MCIRCIFVFFCLLMAYAANAQNNSKEIKTVSVVPQKGDSARDKKGPYTYVEQMPKAGYNYNAYLAKNIRFPRYAREHGIQGKVVVRFLVEEDGSIDSCSVVRGAGGGLDEEALRVVSGFPKWIPGVTNGKPVKVYFTLPINFNLGNDKK